MAPAFLVCVLLIAAGASAAGDDGARELPHLQLPGTPDSSCGHHGSDAPPPPQGLMDIMSMSGCGRFAALVAATPIVSDVFQQRLVAGGGGLTLFCPDDKAVAAFEPTFRALLDSERLDVLLHHAADARYDRAQIAAFDWVAVRTLAIGDAAQALLVRDRGDIMKVRLRRTWARDGLGLATVTNTVSSSESEAPLILHVVDAVLLQQKPDGGDETMACAAGHHPWLECFVMPICSVQVGRIGAYLLSAEHGGKGKIVMAAIVLLALGLMESRAYLQRTSDLGRGHDSDAPPPPQGQLMEIMSTSGCGRFAALVAGTPNVSDILQHHLLVAGGAGGGGLTVFCPDDKAVAAFEPTFRELPDSDRLDLLLRHAADARYVRGQLADFDWVAVRTLAVADAAQTILVRNRGDNMNLWLGRTWPRDGLGQATVTNTVSSSESEAPLIVHVVDAVLLRKKQQLDGGGFPSWQELRCCIIPCCAAICVVLLIGIIGHLFWPEYDRW